MEGMIMVIATTMANNGIRFRDIWSTFLSSCYGAVSELYKSSGWRRARSRLFYWWCGGTYGVLHGQNVSRVVGWRYSVCEEGRNERPLTKASLLAKTIFPPPLPNPHQADNQPQEVYPEPYPDPPPITTNQVIAHLVKLSLYKAHGPDGIPNIVLKECTDLITTPLTNIFKVIIDLNMYYDPWKEFTTITLRKPGKPNYETPKAYRPIALILTMAKLLTAIIAEHLSNIVEHHQILPKNHFSIQPGRSTTDVIHYLISKIHKAWNQNKVVSILFLDIEGAFPNAVTTCLIHNMKQQRIPTSIIIKFIQNLLTNRSTCIKFNNYVSEPITLENGIGQGDPLSMILYILYNTDLLDLPVNNEEEDALSYVDDIHVALVTTGNNLYQTTQLNN